MPSDAKYSAGQVVWLSEFDPNDGDGPQSDIQPRQKAVIIDVTLMDWGWSYVGNVDTTDDPSDDGLREFDEEQIEGLA